MDADAIAALCDGSRFAPQPLTDSERSALATRTTHDAPAPIAGDYPEWLDPYLAQVFGDDRAAEATAMASRAPLDLRVNALKAKRIAGAALDCLAEEPVTKPHRFGEFDNVILAPHSLAWTRELFRDIGRSVCQGMVDLTLGNTPRGVVNPDVFDKPSFQQQWARIRG